MYAMVNVSQYQIVATGNTVAECERNYRGMLANNGMISEEQTEIESVERGSVSGRIVELRSAVIDGNTHYFIALDTGSHYYRISAAVCELAVTMNVGDYVSIDYNAGEGSILEAVNVEYTTRVVEETPAA